MSSVLNVTNVATPTATAIANQAAALAQQAPTVQQPTLTQLLEEPAYELQLQAQEGNTLAAQLLQQQQYSGGFAGAHATGGTAIDFLA